MVIKLTGNVAENFKLFEEEVMFLFEATEITSKQSNNEVKMYRKFNFDPKEETIEIIVKKIRNILYTKAK